MADLPSLDADYLVESPLGRGGAGVVLRARERRTGRAVALKCTQPRDETARARFLREGQVAAQLNHPGIVKVHRVGLWKGQLCLVYELVVGARPLDEAFAELELPGRLDLLAQAAEALACAHAAGLVHRDVKGDNVLVDAEGRVRVADFGLATGAEFERLTRTGALLGTPQTMSPEQVNARGGITAAADVWALGVLLYQALCGRLPFEGAQSLVELCVAITSARFDPPSAHAPQTPPALEQLCMRALELDHTRRLPDGAAFLSALSAAREEASGERAPRWPLVLGALVVPALALPLLSLRRGPSPGDAAATPLGRPSAARSPTAATPTPKPLTRLEREVAAVRAQPFGPRPLPEGLAQLEAIERDPSLAILREACAKGQVTAAHGLALRLLDDPGRRQAGLDYLRWGARCEDRLCRQELLRRLSEPEERGERLGWLAVHAERGEPQDVLQLGLAEQQPGELGRIATAVRRSLPLDRQLHLVWELEAQGKLTGQESWGRLLRASARCQEEAQLREIAGPLLAHSEHTSAPADAILSAGFSRDQLAALCVGLCGLDEGLDLAAPLIRARLGNHERAVIAFRQRVYERRRKDAHSAESFAWLSQLPRSAKVLNELGKAWLWGFAGERGSAGDRARGRERLREAIAAGNTEAVHHLYASYRWDSSATPAERAAAREAAIEQGNHEAMLEQVSLLQQRDDTPANRAAVEALLRRAFAAGSKAAAWRLADVHRARRDYVEAERLLLHAAKAGELPAMERLALILEKGQPRLDPGAAAEWRERAAMRLYPDSMRRLAQAYLAGRAFPAGDPAHAARASAAGDPLALRRLAAALPAEREGLSLSLLYAAAQLGDGIAASALVERFWQAQPYQLRRLSERWRLDAHALRRMARIYARGRGGPVDVARADALRERARQLR